MCPFNPRLSSRARYDFASGNFEGFSRCWVCRFWGLCVDCEEGRILVFIVIDDSGFVVFGTVINKSTVGAFDVSWYLGDVGADRDVMFDGAVCEWSFPP